MTQLWYPETMSAEGFTHRAKPFTWNGRTWPSMMAFCREFGLHASAVHSRLKSGVTDARLIERSLLSYRRQCRHETR